MSLKDIDLKKSYSSDIDDLLFDFYIPVLRESVKYDRLAGFFSSSALSVAAKGIVKLIKNGGDMRMIVCPRLSEVDKNAIVNYKNKIHHLIEKVLLEEIQETEVVFKQKPVRALSWMIANNKLVLKVAIVYDNNGKLLTAKEIQEKGIFHQKVGLFYDRYNNSISFSGSINESASAWLDNIEEFKVFKRWGKSEYDFYKSDLDKFNRIWNGQSNRIELFEVPQAVKKEFIDNAPDDINKINWDEYHKKLKRNKIKLFNHQKKAVENWLNNNMSGLFEMATGTGKTFAALGCLRQLNKRNRKSVTIIACPQSHLLKQWKKEMGKFQINYEKLIFADGTNKSWKNELADAFIDIDLSHINKFVVLTTHRTLSSSDFIKLIKELKRDTKIFLIADEVHGLGAKKSKKGLLEEYEIRLGLSATPKRWYDDLGTDKLYEYFNGSVFEFGLNSALSKINPATGQTYLTPYRYIPKFVRLNRKEIEDYIDKTMSIIKRFNSSDEEDRDEIFEMLLFQRADIIKNAIEKYGKLDEILHEMEGDIRSTIVYSSPQQIDRIMEILNLHNLTAHRFTQEEGTNPEKRYNGLSQREYLLRKFSEHKYQVLVAMKCLDEGVDVPNAENAILMASSTNPREYIQRIGRVIRRHPQKREAKIYDIIVIPSINKIPSEWRKIEKRIFDKELKRAIEIASNAKNNANALQKLYNIKS